ncbi:MAG: hypothetical protein OXI22_24375 [Defluviicoccus sp.]|nr:hypothetical protein [Defluviicoccus sp.]MDE0387038.1 hypothetical protein [Defluviicoccus sp.]
MILHAFRKHLADELEKLPSDPEQPLESYMVTTAALARQLLDYLAIEDLTVPNAGLGEKPPAYPLRKVLDRILHFRALHQDGLTSNIPGKPDLVTLYSDHSQEYGNHFYIRLRDHRDVVGRLAHDDSYVGRHLFRRAVTLLNNVMRESNEPSKPRTQLMQAQFRHWVQTMLFNAWNLLVTLIEDGSVSCPDVGVECYELCFDNGTEEYLHAFSTISTVGDLLPGNGPVWWWAPFAPLRFECGERETWCVLLTAVKSEAERTTFDLVVPFDSFIGMFQDARRQLDGQQDGSESVSWGQPIRG